MLKIQIKYKLVIKKFTFFEQIYSKSVIECFYLLVFQKYIY